MRVFLDSNVLVSAVGTRGLCADLLRRMVGEHELIVSEQVLEELRRTLRRKWKLPDDLIDAVEEELRLHQVEPAPQRLPRIDLRDPADLPILASAIAAGADVLVTGDRDLLEVAGSVSIRIVDPRTLWEMLKHGRPEG